MPTSQQHITGTTPMGANLTNGGAMFQVWAPDAHQVHAAGDFNGWARDDSSLLQKNSQGYWTGFIPDVHDGMEYKFHVVGEAGPVDKRDPYARELTVDWPKPDCIVRAANSYPWQDWTWLDQAIAAKQRACFSL